MTREAPSKFVTQEINTQKTQERQQQQQQQQQKGVVPYLRTFLSELLMMHLTMEDYLEGGEINLRKRNAEYEIMREILLLQVAANNYNLNPNEQFGAWFRDMERLSENESYILSCQLEPRS
ncbi:ral-GDS-related protein isoform X1 [Neomonachus schauinslandi]|uniref:Ral-GDS-related protein isoform X1 n=1 Tax=Neomonachus schauinslandi TaxID=29088 RepID=A0A8M1M3L8_NEOSC|nr:ral-GDS-related protein isoform X1 [Neomonachus schauinslandi]